MKAFQTQQLGKKICRLTAAGAHPPFLANPLSMRSQVVGSIHQFRSYASEMNDYVYHIKAGNIGGVDPSVIDACPVCSAVYKEMTSHSVIASTITSIRIEEVADNIITPEVASRLWDSLWLLFHETANTQSSLQFE
mmetsp:Transcript_15451/g.25843  ORF Transcript_15451/g.25843 Transcript_15451/m.25843 type:complete len:136 (-) Transcript_15451:1055-1462(-)